MATVYRENKERSKRQYISTASFHNNFFTYVVSTNPSTFVTSGVLTPNVTGATAATCPAGRILRETGRRLFPGAHPGVFTLMVAVYDNVSLLSGFIDPNSNMFAVFNSDKPWEVVDGTDLSGNAVHRGQSVFTSGTVTAGSGITMSGGAFIQNRTISTLVTGAATLTIPQILGGLNIQAAAGTQALTLPATASIITALGSVVGATCTFVYHNSAAQAVTVTPASGTTTLVGSATVNNAVASFLVVVASATTVTVYRTT